jgi:hypothetical protein
MPHPSNNAVRPNAGVAHANNNTMKPPHVANNARANAGNVRANATNANAGSASGVSRSVGATGGLGVAATGSLAASATRPHSYTYGSGTNARNYHAYGYGHGYRNRSSGRGYGRSQGNNRAIVSRLRSVHSSLARLDHDYRGHRVKAMHSIAMAVRQLSHRSTSLGGNGNGVANRANMNNNNGRGLMVARNGANGGARQGQGQRMPQAQSDARMSQALRTTQGIHMQMANQGSNSSGHYGARTHVARAVRELHTALAVR